MTKSEEFDNFNKLTRKLIQVPHSEVKAKLDEEKRIKASGRLRSPPPSALQASRIRKPFLRPYQ